MSELFSVEPLAVASAQEAQQALLVNPRGVSFGRLGDIAVWLSGCQGLVPPVAPTQARVVIFAGEHGIAQRGISAFAPEATAQQVAQLNEQVSPAHALARRADAHIRVVATPRSGCIDVEDAIAPEAIEQALALGQECADAEIDSGADLLIPGDVGVGNTTVAAAVMGRLTGIEPVAIIGPGSGITDALWKNKVAVIRDAMFRARNLTHPVDIVRCIGGHDLAALVGFITRATVRRTPVLFDSPLTAVAAVIAERLAPGAVQWMQAASMTREPAHHQALEDLQLQPLLDMGITTGQAVGSLTALGLIRDAVEVTAEEIASVRD